MEAGDASVSPLREPDDGLTGEEELLEAFKGPDMAAVYVLLGCLALSAGVILAILLYCTAQCWPQNCWSMPWDWVRGRSGGGAQGGGVGVGPGGGAVSGSGLGHGRRTVPAIKISATSVSELNDPASFHSNVVVTNKPRSCRSWKMSVRNRNLLSGPTGAADPQKQKLLEKEEDRPPWMDARPTPVLARHPPLALHHEPVSPTRKALLEGRDSLDEEVGSAGAAEVSGGLDLLDTLKAPRNGRLSPSVADIDPDKRSILHYELDYSSGKGEEAAAEEKSVFKGTLTFALRYDFIHRVLMAHVLKANALSHKDKSSSSSDPYVKMYLLPDMRGHCKTRIHRKTLDPEFNEMFSFDTPYASLSSHMLQFTVYDFDRFTRHDLIGNVIMRDLFEKSDLYAWTEYTMHIVGSNDKDDFGDLLLYLTYSPQEQKLGVSVAKAYNLRPMDITGASDPYVRIEEVRNSRRVRKKKTSTKRANLNPVYNETLVFDIPADQLSEVNLLVTVMDWDRIGSDDLLGCCVIGEASPSQEGREQWQECIAQALGGGGSSEGGTSRLAPPARKQSSAGPKAVGRWHSLLAEIPDEFKLLSSRSRQATKLLSTSSNNPS